MKRKFLAILLSLLGLLICWAAPCAGQLTSTVKRFNGMPSLFVNGKLTSSLIGFTSKSEDLPDFLKAGFRILDVGLPFDWVGPEKYDFSKTDEEIEKYLQQEPSLLLLPRIGVTPGRWWCDKFPNDITLKSDGSRAGMFGEPCYFSFASENYRTLSHRALAALLTHLESKYGNRIVGYFVCNGVYGEWFSWNAYWEVPPGTAPPKNFGVEDYSPAAQNAFRQWLKEKYQGKTEDLRRSWGDSKVSFATARVPSEEIRKHPTHGIFFDPEISRQVPDYFDFFNDLIADVLLEECRWTKELTHRRKIVGVFYGYLWTNYPHQSLNHSGHLGFDRVLRSRDIDFIASPYTYDNRMVGGADTSQTLPTTIALHDKLYFNEVDTETHLHQRQWRWGDSQRLPRNLEETRGLLTRDFGYAFSGDFGMWYMDLLGGMFHDPEIIKLFSAVRALDQRYLEAAKPPSAEVAVVLDEDSFRYFADGEILFTALLAVQKQWGLVFMGTPLAMIRLKDFDDKSLPDYKCYIMLNTFYVTPEQRVAVQAKFKRNHATAVWVYAPGYIGRKLSVENMRILTGIRLAESDSPGELRVQITSQDHPYTQSLPAGLAYGTDVNLDSIRPWFDHHLYLKDPSDSTLRRDLPGFSISPRFWGDDPGAKVLGRLAGLERPGLLVKEQEGWTSVYSSAPILPAALLRNIARAAGCHIYSDANDVVYANRNFLTIYSPSGGTRTIRLPRTARVVDLMEGGTLSEGKTEFSLTMPPNTARLLALE
jgi:hypothetical protein